MDRYLLPTHPPGFLDVIPDDIKEDDENYKLPMLRSFESSEQGEDGLNGRVLIMEGKQSINEENTFPMRGLQHFDNMDASQRSRKPMQLTILRALEWIHRSDLDIFI